LGKGGTHDFDRRDGCHVCAGDFIFEGLLRNFGFLPPKPSPSSALPVGDFFYPGEIKMSVGLILLVAAILEVGGDALVRWGLRSGRILGFILGAAVLFAYSVLVNLPKWDFGRLLGVYIVLFFIASQAIGVLVFQETLPVGRIVGGALIAAGGLCVALWK
jgi:drug/metabolite transporter superfamily protein YnfA